MSESQTSPRKAAKPQPSMMDGANEARKLRQLELRKVPIELQVRDVDHAKSEEVVQYSITFLATGGTWEELRRKLGLGPAFEDRRWRIVRAAVNEALIPKSEIEALAAQANMRSYLLEKVNTFVEDVESMIQQLPNNQDDRKVLPAFMKLRLDGLSKLLEENKNSFDAYVDLRKAKAMDKGAQGRSVIIQNNFHIARPGQSPKEVTEAAIDITNQVKAVSGTNNPRK